MGTPEPPDQVRPRHVLSVMKRDGREVPFDTAKIEVAITAAMAAVGHEDVTFAREVANVVELTLAKRKGDSLAGMNPGAEIGGPPQIEAIQDLVETALMELGVPEVAKAYILYREKRARVRDALRVHADVSSATHGGPRVREAEGVAPWSKGRIVGALMTEAELARPQAEEIAAAVERRVLSSGLARVTTGLVRELVASELFERGWTRALQRQGAIGLSRVNIESLLEGRPLAPWEDRVDSRQSTPRERAAGELLRRYSLEEVLEDEVAELALAGDLHVEDLGAPHLPLTIGVEAELFSAGGGAGDAFQLLERVGELTRHVAHGLVIEEPASVLSPLLRATRSDSSLGLSAWLRACSALAQASSVRIDLSLGDARQVVLAARLVEQLAEFLAEYPTGGRFDRPGPPRLFLEGHALEGLLAERPGLADSLEELLARGAVLPTWGEGDLRCVGPGLQRQKGQRTPQSVLGAVALNLPRLARRAGPWREEIVQAGLAELVRAALSAGRSLESFQRRTAEARPGGLRARPSLALVPVGLREALLILGDGVIDPDQGARLIGLIADAARRFSPAERVAVTVSPFHGEAAAARFAWLDERLARADGGVQRWLFSDVEGAKPARPYSTGFGLKPAAGVPTFGAGGRGEAELLRTLSSGALSLDEVVGPGIEEERPHLSAWRRFEVRRRAFAGEVALELFPSGSGRVLRPVR
ncbi:MAG: hypothetical protein ACI8QS_001770 [Planctomycetota bacterium]|jgi:hypothetical protein